MPPADSDSVRDDGDMHGRTSATLLGRLAATPGDSVAWGEFVRRYGPMIGGWCRGRGLQSNDADEVAQAVLTRIVERIQQFKYDPTLSFRAWLKTLTHHAWYDFVQKEKRTSRGTGDSNVLSLLMTIEARDDLATRLEREYDAELLERAIFRTRIRVESRTWQAFELTALDGRPGADVAAELGMKVAHVYVAKSEVLKRLQEEIQKMEQ